MTRPPSVTLKRLVRAREQIHSSLQEGVSLAELAQHAGMSPSYFLRAFRHVFGETPHAYLIKIRLEYSRQVLARGGSITEACFESGYSSVGSYSSLFARRFGVSPKQWRKRVRCLVQAPELWPAVWVPGCFLVAHCPSDLSGATAPPSARSLDLSGATASPSARSLDLSGATASPSARSRPIEREPPPPPPTAG